jgi:hypothetical protein
MYHKLHFYNIDETRFEFHLRLVLQDYRTDTDQA